MEKHISLRTAIITVFVTLAILVILPIINKSGSYDNNVFAQNDVVTEADCRMCHCYNVPDTHHQLVLSGTYECLTCHQIKLDDVSQSYYTEIIRDCIACHGNVVGDRHHRLVQAGTYACLDCHNVTLDNVSRQYTVDLNFTCIVTSSQPSNQTPIADAGIDQTVLAGQSLSFSGAGSYDPDGTILDYTWDFGDSSIGAGITTTHIFNIPGTYTVTLSVTDDKGAMGTDAAVITIQPVIINKPPVADAGPDQTVKEGRSVNFSDAGSYDPDGSVVQYAWNFGDGSTGTGVTTSHTYNMPGIFTVTLSVTDNKGAVGTDTAVITVKLSSDSNRVYADEVLWIDLKNIIDPDDTGIKEDITTKFIDTKSNNHFDLTNQSNNSAKVICMMATIEPRILSQAVIRLRIKHLPKNSIQKIRIYAYNYDGKTIITGSYLDFYINSNGFADLDVTPLTHIMDGYGWMKFRITSTLGKIRIYKGHFILK